jgi:hypothetical protein
MVISAQVATRMMSTTKRKPNTKYSCSGNKEKKKYQD